jgi:hypothetical protein
MSQSSGTCNGGKPEPKPMPYSPPVGPKQSPKPTNHGTGGTQGKR